MARIQRSALLLAAVLLLAAPAYPVSKPHPNFAGVWKLDRDLTTAPYIKDDTLVVRQGKERVKFIYESDGKTTGTDVFVTDGKENNRYRTRIEKAFYRALWKDERLVITTYHVLDIYGYQNYKETDSWTLADKGQTLIQHLSDGKLAVYYYKGPPPEDSWEDKKEFQAVAVFSGGVEPQPSADCRIDLSGTMKSKLLGEDSYRMCLAAEKEPAAAASDCDPLQGTMNITDDDGVSTFVMKVSGRYCAKDQSFVGSYEVDPDRITGMFNQHLSGGSGTLQFSRSTDTVVLYGVLLYD